MAADEGHEGCLADAVGSEQAVDPARRELGGHVGEDLLAAEVLGLEHLGLGLLHEVAGERLDKVEELKAAALVKFANLSTNFDKMRKAYEKEGYKSAAYNKAQLAISEDLMTIRFTVKTIEKLCHILRSQVDDVRRYEREIRKIVVDRCGMPQDHFIRTFPSNSLNLKWAEKEIALAQVKDSGKPAEILEKMIAGKLRKTLSEIVNARAAVSAEMALRLEMAFGKSAQSWLGHQAAYDLWRLDGRRAELGVKQVAHA